MEKKGSVTSVLFLSCLPHAKSDVAAMQNAFAVSPLFTKRVVGQM